MLTNFGTPYTNCLQINAIDMVNRITGNFCPAAMAFPGTNHTPLSISNGQPINEMPLLNSMTGGLLKMETALR
jgi:hypothetical protein